MTSNVEAFEALKSYMIQNFNAKLASGGKEIVKKCHFCGDSRDPTARHLYIGIRSSDGQIVYNCFKCNASGIVDGKFFRDMGCYDPDIINLCQECSRKASDFNLAKRGYTRKRSANQYIIYNNPNNVYTVRKIKYISDRLMVQFGIEEANRFRVIASIKEFLNMNNIMRYTRHPDVIDILDKFFVGFLSMDGTHIILRRLVPEGKLPKNVDTRFIIYNIYGIDNGVKFYSIPKNINPCLPLEVHIAEGIFDILSIYLNMNHINDNAIYIAISGKSYWSVVQYLLCVYGFVQFDLHIYPDADISMEDMYSIRRKLSDFNIPIFIHRNIFGNEKDYGVPKCKIQDNVIRI